jgi:hypothetical protein
VHFLRLAFLVLDDGHLSGVYSIAKQNQQIAAARLSMYSADLHEPSDQLISNISPRGDYVQTGV